MFQIKNFDVLGVRPYKCNLCEKSFTQRCSLESHCMKVHGVAHSYEYKQRRSKVSQFKRNIFFLDIMNNYIETKFVRI